MIRGKNEFNDAVEFYLNDEYEKAIELFEDIVKKEPRNLDARFNLALCYMRMIGMEKEHDEWFIPEDETLDEVYAVRAISELNEILKYRSDDEEVMALLDAIKKVMDME